MEGMFSTTKRPDLLTQWGKGEPLVYHCMSYRCGLPFYKQRIQLSRKLMKLAGESYEMCPRCQSYAVRGILNA